ncbi:uncharacterized protein N7459_008678 [Penicillium hispanicum]|uniref:uncharacterized protein n=1 Tax=Penicillium hispanicum TaxID=1080232 RepID=UPI0025406144|nr:uncharacterized protein N7459_008678 [Penicillium hispanicum]KAJ5574251.1 hypothetical protein N7459_008678 [Penicillium hispanicum]
MGWVGLGIFIATAVFLYCRYPPVGWNLDPPSSSTPPDSDSDAPPTPPAEPFPASHDGGPSTSPLIEAEDIATTPKASASSAPPPVLAVPVLNLDGDSGGNNTAGAVMGSSLAGQSMNGSERPSALAGRSDGAVDTTLQPPSLAPSLSSQAQQQPPTRSATSVNTSAMMPPPPVPRSRPTTQPTAQLQPPRPNASGLQPPPSLASRLRAPPSGLSNSTLAPVPLTLKKSPAASKKVILEPGYSPLDWAALAANPNNQLRGAGMPPGLLRVTPSLLKSQNGRKGRDAWTSYQGKVYNISPYLPYHPGGKGELLRGAGKDSARLFQEIHPWVNWDGILSECLVGILVSENDVQTENGLDAMD